jgi:uroporphyrinogen decarboxylase
MSRNPTPRENFLSLYRRTGYQEAPVGMHFCPHQVDQFRSRHPEFPGDYLEFFEAPYRIVYDPGFAWNFDEVWRIPGWASMDWHRYYPGGFRHAVRFDGWGVAHEHDPDCQHMTRMHHPLTEASSMEDLERYPWPALDKIDYSYLRSQVEEIHSHGLAVFVWAECTIWETAWYLRSMDNLFLDMADEDPMATYLFDKITDLACLRARQFAHSRVDILGLGDDIGMQQSTMMSVEMYRAWLKPRLARVIKAAKEIHPEILISYHSDGYILPFIDDLIELGVDILNPVQPECMSFAELHARFGGRLSFSGTLGTQRLLPFGTPEQIREEVHRNLKLAGPKGGLFCCPTHMVEPEVPWENIMAYVDAAREFRP